eukprot:4559482-Pleurochrysis_carterae.AAC.1
MANGSAAGAACAVPLAIGSSATKRSLPAWRRASELRVAAERPSDEGAATRELPADDVLELRMLAEEVDLARVDVVDRAVHLHAVREDPLLDHGREFDDALHRVEHVNLGGQVNLLLHGALRQLLDCLRRRVDNVVEHLADGAADRRSVAARKHGLHGRGDGAAIGMAGHHDQLAIERANG